MKTEVYAVDPLSPETDALARAAGILRAGGLVAFPTETVYGLGADALNAAAVHGIFTAKGRPPNNPLIVHIADVAEIHSVAAEWPEIAARLAAKFWPGPLTLVLPRNESVPDVVTAGGPTIAVRLPAHPVALALLRAVGRPLAAPSANRSTQLSPTLAEHVRASLDGRIAMILDAGPTSGGLESTVLDVTVSPPRLLRPGLISPAQLEAVIGSVQRSPASVDPTQTALPSPGMLARHYAPRTPLELSDEASRRVRELIRAGKYVGWLTFASEPENLEQVTFVSMPNDPAFYAARLYSVLHRLDALSLDCVLVETPPDGEEWLAVRDRLQRAATPE